MRKILFLLFISISSSAISQTLVTNEYELTITELCEEGIVGCDNVVLNMIPHDSADKKRIGGEAFHTMCADGVTPCAFQGYRFKTKNEIYRILDDGTFQIFDKNGKQILSEKGKWL